MRSGSKNRVLREYIFLCNYVYFCQEKLHINQKPLQNRRQLLRQDSKVQTAFLTYICLGTPQFVLELPVLIFDIDHGKRSSDDIICSSHSSGVP